MVVYLMNTSHFNMKYELSVVNSESINYEIQNPIQNIAVKISLFVKHQCGMCFKTNADTDNRAKQ